VAGVLGRGVDFVGLWECLLTLLRERDVCIDDCRVGRPEVQVEISTRRCSGVDICGIDVVLKV
jgi:hypothetical protein